ncbi:hypothetical protein [uncultured Gemmiger sp.]|uniref:hypothetical protein n=1 Tax=uncultured Gemmiger sp. TaxID=1623490 RepID=UPI0025F893B8|nr:hypothetical protein [uncultured Gemmiger sp.]
MHTERFMPLLLSGLADFYGMVPFYTCHCGAVNSKNTKTAPKRYVSGKDLQICGFAAVKIKQKAACGLAAAGSLTARIRPAAAQNG